MILVLSFLLLPTKEGEHFYSTRSKTDKHLEYQHNGLIQKPCHGYTVERVDGKGDDCVSQMCYFDLKKEEQTCYDVDPQE